MKRFVITVLAIMLLIPALLSAGSVKYLSTLYSTYNPVFTNSKELQPSPLTLGFGMDTATYFLNDQKNGFGVMTKMDVGFDINDINKTSFLLLIGTTYQRTINPNLILSVGFGPGVGILINTIGKTEDSAVALGGALDLQLMLHPTPSFGFTFGATGYALPLGIDDGTGRRTQIYSVSTSIGFAFAFGAKNEDDYFLPPFAPTNIYLNYQR